MRWVLFFWLTVSPKPLPPTAHCYNFDLPEIRHSVCALDCPDACSLLINVENGKGTRLRGNPEHSMTRGFLCGKVARYLEREYSPVSIYFTRAGTRYRAMASNRIVFDGYHPLLEMFELNGTAKVMQIRTRNALYAIGSSN